MIIAAVVILAVVILRSWIAGPLERAGIALPLVLIALGAFVGWETSSSIIENLTNPTVERVVEIVLAIMLFADATEVGRWRRDLPALAGIVLIAIPVSIVATSITASLIDPRLTLAAGLVVACIVMPTDLAPAATVVKDHRVPGRVRDLLNIESGYNDGIIAPIFLFTIAVMELKNDDETEAMHAIADSLPSALIAIAVGLIVGALAAGGSRLASRWGWATPSSLSIGTLAVPLVTYAIAVGLEGNGFVAAFVAGLTYRAVFPRVQQTLHLTEDVITFTSTALWFVLGQLLALTLTLGFDWRAFVISLLAVTVLRVVPVFLVLLGTSLPRLDRFVISWFGPRGVASIVFALLALPHVAHEEGLTELLLSILVYTVTLSALMHGGTAPLVARLFERRRRKQQAIAHPSGAEPRIPSGSYRFSRKA